MPENAAAEGGFGLSAGEAFGGQVGTGGLSGSAVGGAQGGLGAFGGGNAEASNPAAQAEAAQNAISVATGLFSNNGVQAGLLGLVSSIAPGMSPSAPAPSPGFNPEDAFGLNAPGRTPGLPGGGGLMSASVSEAAPSVDAGPSASPAGMFSAPSAPAPAPGPGAIVSAPPSSYGPPAILSVDIAPPTAPTVDVAPTFGITAPTAVTPTAPSTNVSPAQIAQDISRPTVAPATTTPAQSTYSEKGLLGRLAQDLAMGLSINPFASREDQAAGLRGRGYSQADIDGYFGRTDANVAATNAAVENAVGTRDYISDAQLKQYAQSLSPQKAIEFDRMNRQQQLQQYYRAMGY